MGSSAGAAVAERAGADPAPIAELVDRVHEVVKASLGRLQGSLGSSEITYGQFWALHTVAGKEAVSVSAVARSLGVSPPTVCAALDQLEAAGLLVRHRSARDRREVDLALTARGRRVESRVWSELTGLMSAAGAGIPERDVAAAVRVFRTLAERLAPEQPDPRRSA